LFAVFAPFSMIMFLFVWSPATGISGFAWIWMGLGILLDVLSYSGGGIGGRKRFGC
jgi:hypothetical protein